MYNFVIPVSYVRLVAPVTILPEVVENHHQMQFTRTGGGTVNQHKKHAILAQKPRNNTSPETSFTCKYDPEPTFKAPRGTGVDFSVRPVPVEHRTPKYVTIGREHKNLGWTEAETKPTARELNLAELVDACDDAVDAMRAKRRAEFNAERNALMTEMGDWAQAAYLDYVYDTIYEEQQWEKFIEQQQQLKDYKNKQVEAGYRHMIKAKKRKRLRPAKLNQHDNIIGVASLPMRIKAPDCTQNLRRIVAEFNRTETTPRVIVAGQYKGNVKG